MAVVHSTSDAANWVVATCAAPLAPGERAPAAADSGLLSLTVDGQLTGHAWTEPAARLIELGSVALTPPPAPGAASASPAAAGAGGDRALQSRGGGAALAADATAGSSPSPVALVASPDALTVVVVYPQAWGIVRRRCVRRPARPPPAS
jgi:hypothetical protein